MRAHCGHRQCPERAADPDGPFLDPVQVGGRPTWPPPRGAAHGGGPGARRPRLSSSSWAGLGSSVASGPAPGNIRLARSGLAALGTNPMMFVFTASPSRASGSMTGLPSGPYWHSEASSFSRSTFRSSASGSMPKLTRPPGRSRPARFLQQVEQLRGHPVILPEYFRDPLDPKSDSFNHASPLQQLYMWACRP